jgi:hypothetical protein
MQVMPFSFVVRSSSGEWWLFFCPQDSHEDLEMQGNTDACEVQFRYQFSWNRVKKQRFALRKGRSYFEFACGN